MLTQVLVQQTKYPVYPSHGTSRFDAIAAYLSSRNLLDAAEHVLTVDDATAGSRNSTLRVVTGTRSIVLKHFRDWPSNGCAAPAADDRFLAECQFYRAARIANVAQQSVPAMLHQDPRSRCIVFADAGNPRTPAAPAAAEAEALAWFLVRLHHHSQSVPACARYSNPAVRQWLSRQLFPGSADRVDGHGRWQQQLAKRGSAVREALAEARLVLGEGDTCLVHGDFLPRNWLRSDDRLHVVDAEFSFFGRPETDAGSLLAGLLFLRADRDALAAAARVLQAGCVRYDFRMTATFAGVHLCALLDGVRRGSGGPRGSEASALIRRAGRAIESGSLSQLVPA